MAPFPTALSIADSGQIPNLFDVKQNGTFYTDNAKTAKILGAGLSYSPFVCVTSACAVTGSTAMTTSHTALKHSLWMHQTSSFTSILSADILSHPRHHRPIPRDILDRTC